MQYLIGDYLINSENAAKSAKQPSMEVIKWIDNLRFTEKILDYGCGKLRYVNYLIKKCDSLFVLDSDIQLSRKQRIFNLESSIIDYVAQHNTLKILFIKDIPSHESEFDFITCINVLSSIPNDVDRLTVLKNIKFLLKDNGKALFVTQYSDTYFTSAINNSKNILYNDGWIAINKYNSFYGLIGSEKLTDLLDEVGLIILKVWKKNKSVYCEATV